MRRMWAWIVGSLIAVLVIVLGLGFFLDGPLRTSLEQKMNARLQGYTARLGAAHLSLFGFSVELKDLVIKQEAHPDPPVATIPKLIASVQWRALLSGRVVADFELTQPVITINRRHTVKENEDNVPVQERGWQEALQAIYPFKLNEFRIVDGEFTYSEGGASRPLHLSRLNLHAGNIRNVWHPDRVYPSTLSLEATVFDKGSVQIEGHANFLSEPYLGVKARLRLEQVELDYFRPLVQRHNFTIRNGLFSGVGDVEYAPTIKVFHLQKVTIDGVQVTYTHTSQSTGAEKKVARKTVQAAQKLNNKPETILRADRIDIVRSQFGFANTEVNPDYRLVLNDTEFHLSNFTNHLTEGTSVAKLTAKLMGLGATRVVATFRPEVSGPDFDTDVRIEPTPMPSMNNLWRAYGGFDVVDGLFSFYSELKVKNGAISGYVKPIFKEVDVYDASQDKDKNVFQKLYEGVIGGISWVLENSPRDEVATLTTVSGKLQNPEAGTWEAVLGLIQNAFFKAILPGFEEATGRSLQETSQQTTRR
jgi:hypothetical protein